MDVAMELGSGQWRVSAGFVWQLPGNSFKRQLLSVCYLLSLPFPPYSIFPPGTWMWWQNSSSYFEPWEWRSHSRDGWVINWKEPGFLQTLESRTTGLISECQSTPFILFYCHLQPNLVLTNKPKSVAMEGTLSINAFHECYSREKRT